MVKKKIEAALNKQLNAELYSSYLYLSMSAYFQSINLPGFANWMRVQTQEELVHAMKFYDFINERGGRVMLQKIDSPPTKWASPLNVFESAYKHEQKVTGLINDLVNLAVGEKDHATNIFLQWFVTEQVEEEASADEVASVSSRLLPPRLWSDGTAVPINECGQVIAVVAWPLDGRARGQGRISIFP
jgi:ferritin